MFGYVIPPADLPPQETERFRRLYCGLCRVLEERYGNIARWVLNYDFTYLALLLSDSTEDSDSAVKTGRCLIHPVRPRPYYAASPALETAADESVILAWWQLRDHAEDSAVSLPYRAASAALDAAYRKAAAARPAFDGAVRRQIALLHELEQENCPSLDRPADAFASLLRQAAEDVDHPVRRRVLEQMLYHLGRWIYLVDAADDLKRDAASGNYNPVALRYGLTDGAWTETARQSFTATLDHSVHVMAASFELWDFGVWRPILEATIYRGLFQTARAVLDGTFRRARLPRKRKRYKQFPEAGGIPGTLETGEIPVTPETGEIPVTPEAGEIPRTPEADGVPGTPEADGIPGTPEADGIPGTSEAGEIPVMQEAGE